MGPGGEAVTGFRRVRDGSPGGAWRLLRPEVRKEDGGAAGRVLEGLQRPGVGMKSA